LKIIKKAVIFGSLFCFIESANGSNQASEIIGKSIITLYGVSLIKEAWAVE